MKYLIILTISLFSTTAFCQTLEQRASYDTHRSIYRYAHLGAISGSLGTIVGNALGGKPAGIAGGTLASIASSLLVRSRTDGHSALITTGAGLVCTAGLTIGLNKRKKKRSSINCPF